MIYIIGFKTFVIHLKKEVSAFYLFTQNKFNKPISIKYK